MADSASHVSVVIAGGGTGGHLYPGIAVAQEIRRRLPAARVSFAGTSRGLEARAVPAAGFELDVIRSAGLKGKSLSARLRGAALLVPGMADAWGLISRRAPSVVIGVGGYSSGPVVLAASLRGIPTMVLEQNALPGLTNRLLARVVRAAAVTYEETLPFFRGKGFVTGNPVRAEFFAPAIRAGDMASGARGTTVPRLLILGGSQGAHALNLAAMEAAPKLARESGELDVVHQTGERDLALVRGAYERAGVAARVEPFLDEVAIEMTAATLIVCRAGATTLAELAAIGRPAVLVPLPTAADDHQRKNARVLEQGAAAVVLDERDLTADRLADVVGALLRDRARLDAMAAAAMVFARPTAAAAIVDRALALAGVSEGGVGAGRARAT